MDMTRASEIVTGVLGRPQVDPYELRSPIEFPQGWPVDETGHRGAGVVGVLGPVGERSRGPAGRALR
jgi:hypothetical protein